MQDPARAPAHYRGQSGRQSIEITEAYRLGPHLTQALDHILRAGRKTSDPRQDLAKAAWYCRRAADHADPPLSFGLPREGVPTAADLAADFGIACPHRQTALGWITTPYPVAEECIAAAEAIDLAIASIDAPALVGV